MIRIDFHKNCGAVKPLHGVNNSPMRLNGTQPEFQAAGIPFVRTHDPAGAIADFSIFPADAAATFPAGSVRRCSISGTYKAYKTYRTYGIKLTAGCKAPFPNRAFQLRLRSRCACRLWQTSEAQLSRQNAVTCSVIHPSFIRHSGRTCWRIMINIKPVINAKVACFS